MCTTLERLSATFVAQQHQCINGVAAAVPPLVPVHLDADVYRRLGHPGAKHAAAQAFIPAGYKEDAN